MAKYIGPKCRLSRREGTDLQNKSGIRAIESKCKLDTPPGQFGDKKGRQTGFAEQLRMKQMLRRFYGVLERQFRKYYHEADRGKGSTGEELLKILESRLDNVVYRMGFAATRAEGRQLVSHGAVLVNGKKVTICSYRVKPNDLIEISEKAKNQLRIAAALELAQQKKIAQWLDVDSKSKRGVFKSYPDIGDLPSEFKVNLVIEFYSK